MKINRSYLYLFQTISGYGSTFLGELKNLSSYAQQKVGATVKECYIADVLYYKSKNMSLEKEDLEELMFFVFDPKGCRQDHRYINATEGEKRFYQFLKYCRTNSHFVTDYWVKEGHCIVFKVHKKFTDSYRKFLESKYSQMYTKEQVRELQYILVKTEGKTQKVNYIAAVLLRDHEFGMQKLAKEIYQRFGENTPLPKEPNEYDLPWIKREEYFNYEFSDFQRSTYNQKKNVKFEHKFESIREQCDCSETSSAGEFE
jgi:hypothetical protein